MEQASFHLDKGWEISRIFHEKKYCFHVKLTVEFNKNREVGLYLRIESNGGQLSNTLGLECTSSYHIHET